MINFKYHRFIKGTDNKILYISSLGSLYPLRESKKQFRKQFPNTKILKTTWRITL